MSSVPGGEPHTTKIGLSVVFATSMRSRVNGSLNVDDRAGDRHDDDVDLRVGDDRVEDLAAARVGDRRPAAVDRVAHPQVRGDEPVVQDASGSPWRAAGGAGPAAASMSAMCAPVPPEIA